MLIRHLRRPSIVPALTAALLLAQTARSDLDPPPHTGVTVLVHGFTALNGVSNPPFDYWGGVGGENFAALLRRFGSGRLWQYNPGSGNYDDITGRVPHTGGWFVSDEGEQILLFDWTTASDEQEAGQAEAAADALFASLMRFEVAGQPIINRNPYAAARPLHFVGHSRGTVVASETVQRLGRFNIRVSYVTYIDVHDFGQPGILKDQFFHDPAVQVWENIDYADVFFQQNPAALCGQNPAGRSLGHFPPSSPLQHDITAETDMNAAGCAQHGRPHAWTKDYYWGTVDPVRPNPANWYGGGNGAGEGFDRWFAQGGYRQGPDPALQRVRCIVADDAIPYVWQGNDINDRNRPDRNDIPPTIFNGDFDLPDLDTGIGATAANTLAGWSYFGGGGRAFMTTAVGDPNYFLALHEGSLVATHNRFYLPTRATELRFQIWVPYVPRTGDHVLEVKIGNRVLRRFTVGKTEGWTTRTASLSGDRDLLGGVNTLTFRLFTSPGLATGLTANVRLDNVNFVTRPAGWIHTIVADGEDAFRVHWRCWPAGRFSLESTTDLSTGQWESATVERTGTAGSYIVPRNSSMTYYRGAARPR